jgi:integrase
MLKICALSDAKIRGLKPREKPYQVFDGEGLYLEVASSGSKIWRIQKILNGKVIRRSFGKYPALDLKTAREKRVEFEALLAKGLLDNGPAISTFADLFNEWIAKHAINCAPITIKYIRLRAIKYLLPQIGNINLIDISPQVILNKVLRPIGKTGLLESAAKVKIICGQVLRYGVVLGLVERDFTQDLNGFLPPPQVRHRPTITYPPNIAKLMKNIFSYKGNISVIYALRLLPYLFVRPGELRAALWEEIDLNDKIWRIPAEKMKMRRPHLVPLADQVVAMLTELRHFTGNFALLFPGARVKDRPISDVTLIAALRNLGYAQGEIVPHGFRSMASTLLNERGYNRDWIERQLAHVPGGVRAVYNYAEYLPERRKMMSDWADFLDNLRDS